MKKLVIMLIRLYQKYISSNTSRSCRFYPTCSQYTIEAINKYGLLKGSILGIKRIIRCNPFNPGGYDPLK
jgi:hypothetical protein